MSIILRVNYGDESIALIQAFYQNPAWHSQFKKVKVVYVETGWAAAHWPLRVRQGESFAINCGFEVIHLYSKEDFAQLAIERKDFPSQKFQWCAGFLKGLPLIEWLDSNDPAGEWLIALPKRQSLYRKVILEKIPECEFHGDRQVWHPLLNYTDEDRDKLVIAAGFNPIGRRSLECEPCVNSTGSEHASMHELDKLKLHSLELKIGKKLKPIPLNQTSQSQQPQMQSFSMGCGDPFGCGL